MRNVANKPRIPIIIPADTMTSAAGNLLFDVRKITIKTDKIPIKVLTGSPMIAYISSDLFIKSSGVMINSIPLAIRINPSPNCMPLIIGLEKKPASLSIRPVKANNNSIILLN